MVNFLQHIFHTGHQNSKWRQNETFHLCSFEYKKLLKTLYIKIDAASSSFI